MLARSSTCAVWSGRRCSSILSQVGSRLYNQTGLPARAAAQSSHLIASGRKRKRLSAVLPYSSAPIRSQPHSGALLHPPYPPPAFDGYTS
jgi:hypothetical protein